MEQIKHFSNLCCLEIKIHLKYNIIFNYGKCRETIGGHNKYLSHNKI